MRTLFAILTILLGLLYGASGFPTHLESSKAIPAQLSASLEFGEDFDPYQFKLLGYSGDATCSWKNGAIAVSENGKLEKLYLHSGSQLIYERSFHYQGSTPYTFDSLGSNFPLQVSYRVFSPDTVYDFYLSLRFLHRPKKHPPFNCIGYHVDYEEVSVSLDLGVRYSKGLVESFRFNSSGPRKIDFDILEHPERVIDEHWWQKSIQKFDWVNDSTYQVTSSNYDRETDSSWTSSICERTSGKFPLAYPIFLRAEPCAK